MPKQYSVVGRKDQDKRVFLPFFFLYPSTAQNNSVVNLLVLVITTGVELT